MNDKVEVNRIKESNMALTKSQKKKYRWQYITTVGEFCMYLAFLPAGMYYGLNEAYNGSGFLNFAFYGGVSYLLATRLIIVVQDSYIKTKLIGERIRSRMIRNAKRSGKNE